MNRFRKTLADRFVAAAGALWLYTRRGWPRMRRRRRLAVRKSAFRIGAGR